jgi:hypothetical protein
MDEKTRPNKSEWRRGGSMVTNGKAEQNGGREGNGREETQKKSSVFSVCCALSSWLYRFLTCFSRLQNFVPTIVLNMIGKTVLFVIPSTVLSPSTVPLL